MMTMTMCAYACAQACVQFCVCARARARACVCLFFRFQFRQNRLVEPLELQYFHHVMPTYFGGGSEIASSLDDPIRKEVSTP